MSFPLYRVAKTAKPSFNRAMLFEFSPTPRRGSAPQTLLLAGARQVPLLFKRHPRARRYVLRLDTKGRACVTIPRRGSVAAALQFAESNRGWLERQLQRLASAPKRPSEWFLGTEILFRGESVRIDAEASGDKRVVQLGGETVKVADTSADLRSAIERHLRLVAGRELPGRVFELAAVHGLQVQRVAVRNQRSRWGSCSHRATISLNWRLVQVPTWVRDYIIVHELMHLRHMNHSARFWNEVERAFPQYRTAEHWLKAHSSLLQ